MMQGRFLKQPSLFIMVKNLLLIIFISELAILGGCKKNMQSSACFGNHCFLIEISKTDQERQQGLMFRKYLGRNKGMLFIFEKEDIYPFWMKNTLIPLDIIWINSNKEVVFIARNAIPCKDNPCPSINPQRLAKYVLELNAGTADQTGLKSGDKLILKLSSQD